MIGGFSLLALLIRSIIKWKKWYDNRIQTQVEDEQDEEQYHATISELVDSMNVIQKNIEILSSNQDSQTEETRQILDQLSSTMRDIQRESAASDVTIEKHLKGCDKSISNIGKRIMALEKKTNLLLDSDKEGIKSFIVDKYFESIDNEYISAYDLDRVEKRYDKYLKENGDTYVEKLMTALRALPNVPVEKTEDNK